MKIEKGSNNTLSYDDMLTSMNARNDWGGAIFEDSSGDYFMPMEIKDGEIEGIVFSLGAALPFTYSYGRSSQAKFRRVTEPISITFKINE